MKKKLTLNTLFVFAMILSAAFAGSVSAQTERNSASGKAVIAYAPEVSANVVINEVYGGSETGGVYNADFIELYNLSSTAVNISDYSVQYYTAGQVNLGAPTSTAHIPDGTILQPHGYYVIQVSPATGSGAPLPVVNLNAAASFAATGIASDSGKLVLSSTGADLADCTQSLYVVDRVAWGSTPDFVCNETANAGQPSTSTSVQRRLSATPDTDNNSTDFTPYGPPTPGMPLTTTAATVSVGGRVTDANGRGISIVLVRMTDSAGVVHTIYTNKFGYYDFADVEVGQTLIFNARAKRYSFTAPTQVVSLNEELTTVDFTAY